MLKKNKEKKITFFNGDYEAIELIGEGSYGKVYKAKKDEYGIQSFCAIKTITIPSGEQEITLLKKEGMSKEKQKAYFKDIVDKWIDEIKLMESFKDSINIVNIEDFEVIGNQIRLLPTIFKLRKYY